MALRAPSEAVAFAGFLRGLPSFLEERISLDQAIQVVRGRLANREANFLELVGRAITAQPNGVYSQLLGLAGCSLADLRAMVRADGLEASLRALREAGVYVTFEEFKGLRPIERAGRVIQAGPSSFDNPSFRRYLPVTTGGSTASPRRVLMDLDFLRSRIPSQLIMAHAHGLLGAPLAQWAEIPPGHGLEAALLQVAHEAVPERWFWSVYPRAMRGALRFRLATQLAVSVARRSGVPFPRPEYLPFDRADVIASWAHATLRDRGRCVIRAHVSKALRVALAAEEMGIGLEGVTFSSGGEPATSAKVGRITGTGARFIANYFLMEAGPVGFGCAAAADSGDQHLLTDHLALVAHAREIGDSGVSVNSFHITTLLPSAPKILLNVETDDYGDMESGACDCPLGALGFTTHLRNVRSFGKLTGESVTLVGSQMEQLLERALPSRFGGTPLDYQLVEEEDRQGFTRLTLLVHPRLEVADEELIAETVRDAMQRTGGAVALSAAIWDLTGTFRVRREAPWVSPRGKHQILRTLRKNATASNRASSVHKQGELLT